ncbi:mucin-2 [Pectinophora gossypiella]|nr:mucin-2 [Pectinophora gossypiella]
MDRRRAAGALLALAACIATTAGAPTASNHTALDLYDEHTEGCYYNFQHYGEGDRIMTNEPCLNCTCHNRMLMCYLRVCPFTKAIGQDCTVEKRADQCCPIVTCPDVPVDLLTSTSTSSPAEYGGTGVGKVDNYGCTLNGKYFPEGSKVPATPNKPCEHCYCIRNMTTCVMQECTLHVDGCTPIYHKDVCCPVRYFCDHPEDEIPLLDDMTTTVRPTPGFLLTTIAPTEITTTPPPARKDCVENGQLYEDGALIKTDKPCEHCYCMKGDIVCVVQECGTPMENEGKNCTSVPPRAGHCCPDTYICEGDELTPGPTTELPFEESTTMLPSRRVSVEGSGYRNDDEITLMPTFATDIEGSGEEEIPEKPLSTSQPDIDTTELDEKLGLTEQGEFIPKTTQTPVSDETAKLTTEPDKYLNTVPSDHDEGESTESSVKEKTTLPDQAKITEYITSEEITTPKVEGEASGAPPTEIDETPVIEMKPTESTLLEEQSTSATTKLEEESTESSIKETTPKSEEKVTELPVLHEDETQVPLVESATTEKTETFTVTDGFEATEQPPVTEQEQAATTTSEIVHEESSQPSIVTTTQSEQVTETDLKETRGTSAKDEVTTEKMAIAEQETTSSEITEEVRTEPTILESTPRDKLDVTESVLISEQSTVSEKESTEPYVYDKTTPSDVTETPIITQEETMTSAVPEKESSEPSILEKTTARTDLESTESPTAEKEQPDRPESSTKVPKLEEDAVTTESPHRRQDDETSAFTESVTQKDTDIPITVEMDVTKEIVTPSSETPIRQPIEHDLERTTTQIPEQDVEEKTTQLKETTTEPIMELSTFAHVDDKESSASVAPESEITSATDKQELPEATTINPEDNEIDEEQSPGRIPGEGDCLLEGVTYKNDSVVPSSNKCHSGCKCVSSIIKCDPIICSPQPEYMDNCQLRYDTPESCCPTYVCDHGKETIPPQPHSQMSGTESPMQSTSVECSGDQCGAIDVQPTTEASKIPERIGDTDCGSNGCNDTQLLLPETPEECIGAKCTQPAESCTDGKCDLPLPPIKEQEIPSKEISKPCDNPEDCKSTHVPTPCDNESCTTIQGQTCDKEGGCETPSVSPCEGDNCGIKPDIAPDTAAPDTVAPDTAAPDTVAPDTAAPYTVAPDTAAPDTAAPDTVAPDTAAPTTFAPDTAAPDTAAPDTVAPHTAEPDTVAPDTDAPHTVAPDTIAPDTVAPDTVAPDTVAPDTAAPDTVAPDTAAPDTVPPDTAAPDTVAPDTTAPDTAAPHTVAPDTVAPDTVVPVKDTATCENKEDCKEIQEVQPPCEGDSCAVAPDSTPSKDIPQPCENEEECRRVEIPVTATEVKEDCSKGECKITTSPVPEKDLCTGQDDCKTPETPEKTSADCKDGKCAESEDKIVPVCTGDECMQREPVSPTQTTAHPEPLSTETPESEQTTSSSFVTKEGEDHTTLPEIASSEVTPEEKVTDQPGHETPVADEEDKVTKAPMDEITTLTPDLSSEGSGEPIDKEEEMKTDITTEVPATEHVSTTPKSEGEGLVTDKFDIPVTEPQQVTETKPVIMETESPQQVTESQEQQTEKPKEPSDEVTVTSTELPKEGHDETRTEEPDVEVTKMEETTKEPEIHRVDEDQATTAFGVLVTDYKMPTEEPGKQTHEEPVETSTSEILRTETTEKSSNQPKSTEASVVGVTVTESPIYETPETGTKQPDIAVEIETEEQEISTKSPLDYEPQQTTTSFERIPDQETPIVEQEKTEAPTVEGTTAPEILITPETTEEAPAKLPERSGDKEDDSAKTTVIPDLEETKTKAPEILDTTETITRKSDESDVQTTARIPMEEGIAQPHVTEPQTEGVTEITAPQPSIPDKISTEHTPSQVTEKELIDITTHQAPVSEDVTKSETEEKEEVTTEKTETDLSSFPSSQPEKTITEAPHSLVTEKATSMETVTESIPEKETEVTDKQEPITVTPAPTVAVPVEHIVTDQQGGSTKTPFSTEGTSPTEDKESSYETESPSVQPHEVTTSVPMLQSTAEKEITPITDVKQPAITEEYEISTEEPKLPGEDEYTPTKQQEIATEAPEVFSTDVMPSELPTVIPEMPTDEKTTTKPEQETMLDTGDKVSSEATEGPEHDTEIPVSSAETHDITEPTNVEKDTTTRGPETSVSEQELTTASPIELTTKEILRERPEPTKPEEISTEVSGLFSTETSQTQGPDTEKEETPTPTITEIPSKEIYTESPATLVTSEPDKPAGITTERSEIPTTEMETEHEEKETEQAQKVTEPTQEPSTEKSEVTEADSEVLVTKEQESAPAESPETTISPLEFSTKMPVTQPTEDKEIMPQETISTSKPESDHSETTPYLVELEEHTHKIDEELSTSSPFEEPTTQRLEEGSEEPQVTGESTETIPSDEKQTQIPPIERDQPEKEETPAGTEGPQTTPASPEETPERITEPSLPESETTTGVISSVPSEKPTLEDKYGVPEQDKEQESTTPTEISDDNEHITTPVEKDKPIAEIPSQPEKDTAEKPQDMPVETTAPEEEFIPVTTATKITTAKVAEETTTQSAEPIDKFTKPEEKPSETVSSTSAPEVSKPDELPPTDEALPPEEESHFPPSGMGGYNQEPDYGEEDQAFGPGTCRYGGKVYVSAQQIPRDDPCDFCFCFRSDIICLQQSCPPPIHGCHEEPIQGFCCPRYECPVSMATTLNVTTTTTTTTTTLPPHFLPHAYKGAAQRRGCQIKGHTYKVGEVVRASSGPCLHCTCGGDGQMKCDPKACTPEPMLRQMIAAAVSAKRRR